MLLHDRQHLARHVDDDRVRVAVRQQPGERAAAAHPVAAGVVDDDQVGAARLGELRGEARAGAGADDRLARLDLRAQPRERLAARVIAISSCRRSAIATANAGIVDVGLELVHLDESRERLAQPCEERLVGVRVVERLPGDGDHRDALQRDEERRRAGRAARACGRSCRPSSAHSSGVVRISVTVGLCT